MKRVVLVVLLCAGLVGTIVAVNSLPTTVAPPSSGLPEDNYRFYSKRATELEAEARRCELAGDSGFEHNKKAASLAMVYAEQNRNEYNRQLSIRLSRALAITGSTNMFYEAYNAQKL